ncbi:MAG TPA: hypothetical protein VJL58_03575, partial [Pyrinomonadaceae bacterium]|nr:hypothetical protein [Pyrinomonadaceae bacterium]
MVRVILYPLIITILAAGAFGQATYTPEKGSAERKAILDALRIPVERDLNLQRIAFVTDSFKISGTWAFVSGVLQTPSGGSPDFKRTKFADAVEAGAFD